MALRLLCHPSSSWTADGRRLLLRMDSESMAAVVVDVVETLSQLLRTLAHCRRTVKISKRAGTYCDRETRRSDDPRFPHAARNLPDFASPNPSCLLHFAAPRSDIHLTPSLVCSIFDHSYNRFSTAQQTINLRETQYQQYPNHFARHKRAAIRQDGEHYG